MRFFFISSCFTAHFTSKSINMVLSNSIVPNDRRKDIVLQNRLSSELLDVRKTHIKKYYSHIYKILSQRPYWTSNSVINNLLKSTCWCCKALLGCLKTGGEPRPRWAKLWICKTIELVSKIDCTIFSSNHFKDIWWNRWKPGPWSSLIPFSFLAASITFQINRIVPEMQKNG